MANKPFSQACENNKRPLLAMLARVFDRPATVLEIGSGTGQHGVFFAESLPHLQWQPSDRIENIPGMSLWFNEAALPNLLSPLVLDVSLPHWPAGQYQGVFTANTLHIMAWPEVKAMFAGLKRVLAPGAIVCIYGPFNYEGRFTSPSNQAFDAMLRSQASHMGIRDIADVTMFAERHGLTLQADHAMPANNRLLVFNYQQ
ncbi:DUF938 domain-containing protein [Oceanisphaera avium]|uniref:Methylase n=1 Tax=Oceanisphaera avium TaxID=1903694 RepID=A0A1Y0CUV9_9GAMM|nr:DUF938 domain-containing protein [Oceanisphaera avium]ART78804.1 methylase [Oceanisphaera avium]